MTLAGRTAVVTGSCGGGIGRSTALCLARDGAGKQLWQGAWRDRPGPACHDIAEPIAMLCSEEARFISGELFRFPGFPGS